MDFMASPRYREDVALAAECKLPWERLQNTTVLISGAGGLIGSCLVDLIMYLNSKGLNCHVLALGRNPDKAKARFSAYWENPLFTSVSQDINKPLELAVETVDYVIHLASNTHPVAYATEPVSTITTNIIGTANLLDFAVSHKAKRFAFASSVEAYGENRGDMELFSEDYCGYINCNTLRAGYPESKRCGEALCQAYYQQHGLDVVIPRLARSYGPTLLATDTKALSQFLHKGLAGEDIVLKSEGNQHYSYTYAMDAVTGLLTVLLLGETAQAYNIAHPSSDITLKELACTVAKASGTQVVFQLPDAVERAGYSTATRARMDGSKLQALGWKPMYSIEEGLTRTLKILKNEQ